MSERFDVFTFDEIRRISCTCAQCGTEVIFDLSQVHTFKHACPGCQNALYPMSEIIDLMREAQTKASEAKLLVKISAPTPV